ncbi:MAG: SH3 domain-containing protein, partial [Deltaproteobacteria bacterium]|nr:SH3 domain-containing protein [Deltaproteobacteria bacterium]
LAIGMSRDAWLQRMLEKRSRTALTSGGEEPVRDSGGGVHSVFAKAFLDVLRNNQKILDGDKLFDLIKRPVILNASQTPLYGDIRMTKHENGDFLLVPKDLKKTGLHQKKKQGLEPDLFRSDSSVEISIIPIEEEYRAKKKVRIRERPDASSPQVGKLKKGESVWVAGEVSDQPWFLVELSDRQGYVFSSLLVPSTARATGENSTEQENGGAEVKKPPDSDQSGNKFFDFLLRRDKKKEDEGLRELERQLELERQSGSGQGKHLIDGHYEYVKKRRWIDTSKTEKIWIEEKIEGGIRVEGHYKDKFVPSGHWEEYEEKCWIPMHYE